MEEHASNTCAAQLIFQHSMCDSMSSKEDDTIPETPYLDMIKMPMVETTEKSKGKEIEDSRLVCKRDSEVWIINGSIEGKTPDIILKSSQN